MLGKTRRVFTVIMVISLLMSLFGLGAYASETAPDVPGESTAPAAPDLYIYKYDGTRYHNGVQSQGSSYLLSFRWMRPDGTAAEPWRTYDVSTGLFNLVTTDGTNENFAAYCADFLYSAEAETTYKRLNLEDAGYFSEGAAAHIRGILNNGYWHTWTDADLLAAETAANSWLEAYQGGTVFEDGVFIPGDFDEAVEPISGLTMDEAITATQLAIWAFANTESDNWWMDFKPYGGADDEDLANNIKAFRKYLIHQQAQPVSAGSIIFTDEAVSSSAVFSTSGEGISYDVTMYFKLKADVAQNIDNLILTAVLGAGTEGEQTITAPLTGPDALVPDANGFYKITFSGVTEGANIEVAVSGTQNVNDVYFYQAKADNKSARTQSQNMVGFATGQTPVTAESTLDFGLGEAQVALFKFDATDLQEDSAEPADPAAEQEEPEAEPAEPAPLPPLAGAEFDLYARVGNNEFLVKSGLVSNAEGMIQVMGLADGYDYFFREVKAPEGYDKLEGDIPAEGEVTYAGNIKSEVPDEPDEPDVPDIPDVPDVPDIPDIPDEPDIPDIPDEPDVPDVPEEPTEPEIPVEEPEVPLEEEPEAEEELVEIDEDVPLADVPKTGSSNWIWYTLTILSGAVLVGMTAAERRRNRTM